MSELRILAGQIKVPATRTTRDRDDHIERCAGAIRRHLESTPVDLVVLPELSSIEYSRAAFECLDQLAEPLEGPSFQIYRELAVRYETTVVYGIARAGDVGFNITQAAAGPEGQLLGHYDKLHIAQFGASMEKDYFVRGSRLLVLDLNGFRVAPIICYDIRFPELARSLATRFGVQAILHCGAYARDESFHSWHAFVQARAMENQCYVLSLNRAGDDYGDSVLCPPWVDPGNPPLAFHSHGEEFRLLSIDPSRIEQARRRYSFLFDRLEDYAVLDCHVARA